MAWVLHKEEPLIYWVYPLRRTRFRKRVYVDNHPYDKGEFLVFGIKWTWYDDVTRRFDTQEETLISFDDILATGDRAIWDWVHERFIYPEEISI